MSDKKEEPLPVPVLPARGARAGVRSDVNRAKSGSYNPVGTGSAWSHNFLNQKPWHPLNFRNQIRKYDAEQKAIQDHKAKEQAMAEWQAEQEKVATLAFLSPEEAKKQTDRASISFLYQKPPGLDAALARDREREDKKQREAAAAAAVAAASDGQSAAVLAPGCKPTLSSAQQQQAQAELLRQRQQQLDRVREDPFAAILAARSALQHSEKFVMKSLEVAHGGAVPDSGNQLLLGDDGDGAVTEAGPLMTADMNDAEALLASLDPEERAAVLAALRKKRRKAEKAARLEQAQDLLRSAGIVPGPLDMEQRHKRHKKEKRRKHKKHKSKEKHNKERQRDSSSGSGNSSDSNDND